MTWPFHDLLHHLLIKSTCFLLLFFSFCKPSTIKVAFSSANGRIHSFESISFVSTCLVFWSPVIGIGEEKSRRGTFPLGAYWVWVEWGLKEVKDLAEKVDHVESHEVKQGVSIFFEWQEETIGGFCLGLLFFFNLATMQRMSCKGTWCGSLKDDNTSF